MNTDFFPSAQRAIDLNTGMNTELGLSLAHICEQAAGEIDFDQDALAGLCQHLRSGGNVAPAVFGTYYNLVQAIYQDDEAEARNLFAYLAESQPWANGASIMALDDPHHQRASEIYLQKWNESLDDGITFAAPRPDIVADFRTRLAEGRDLLRETIPELSGELDAIIRQFVIIGRDGATDYQVDGGSHYQLWGALFLNGHFHQDRVAVAEVLAHESAHSFLFGFCTHEALTNNDQNTRYPSPLRHDLRPMDGIYHATFVSARMHWAMMTLSKSPLLTSEERQRAIAAAEADYTNFFAGHGVVAEHGELTSIGEQLMGGAHAYMQSVEPCMA